MDTVELEAEKICVSPKAVGQGWPYSCRRLPASNAPDLINSRIGPALPSNTLCRSSEKDTLWLALTSLSIVAQICLGVAVSALSAVTPGGGATTA